MQTALHQSIALGGLQSPLAGPPSSNVNVRDWVENGQLAEYVDGMLDRCLLLALLPALAGCAHRGVTADQWLDRSSWSYAPSASTAPLASYGEPNSGGGLSLECIPSEDALQLVITDTDILEDRAVEVRVANVSYRTIELLDPPDGFAVSRIKIPLREPVLAQFAAGAGPMTIYFGDQAWPLPHAPEPVRMVHDCIQRGS